MLLIRKDDERSTEEAGVAHHQCSGGNDGPGIGTLEPGRRVDGHEAWHYTLPGLLADPSLSMVAAAVLWTGLISTSLNFFLEVKALGSIPSAEASVILAAEPLAAAALGSIMLHEELATCDYIGGALIITACLVNTLKPEDIIARTNNLFASSSAPGAAREATKSGR